MQVYGMPAKIPIDVFWSCKKTQYIAREILDNVQSFSRFLEDTVFYIFFLNIKKSIANVEKI